MTGKKELQTKRKQGGAIEFRVGKDLYSWFFSKVRKLRSSQISSILHHRRWNMAWKKDNTKKHQIGNEMHLPLRNSEQIGAANPSVQWSSPQEWCSMRPGEGRKEATPEPEVRFRFGWGSGHRLGVRLGNHGTEEAAGKQPQTEPRAWGSAGAPVHAGSVNDAKTVGNVPG